MTEDEAYQRELSISLLVEAPLSTEEGEDGELHLVDVEVNEHYGFFKGNKLILDNGAVGDESRLMFDIKKIKSIQESDIGFIEIYHKNNTVTKHRMRGTRHELNPASFSNIDYKKPNLTDHLEMIYHCMPNAEDCIYHDPLSDRDMVDLYMFGEEGIVPLDPQLQNNNVVTKACLILEKQSREIITPKGHQVTQRFSPTRSYVLEAMLYIAKKHNRNMFIERIRRKAWDDNPRIADFLYESGGRAPALTEEDEKWYLSTIMRSWMLSILERNMEKKYEPIPFVPVLMGSQGSQKSTLCRKLGMQWYKTTHISFKDMKKFYENVQGSVLVELKESTQFRMDGAEQIKAFVDEVELNYRKSYAADSTDRNIMFSMAATTNNQMLLTDTSGNRRFYPIMMTLADAEVPPRNRTDYEILQMWAEALEIYRQGGRWADGLFIDVRRGELDDRIIAMQESATAEVKEEDDLLLYLNNEYPDINDKVWSYQIRDYLQSEAGYYGENLDRISQKLGNHPEVYGFKFLKRTSVKVNGQWQTSRQYVRVTQPVVKRIKTKE